MSIEDQSLSQMDLTSWNVAVSTHLESENQIFGGRSYLYLRGTDKVSLFDSKTQKLGYTKIPYGELIKITMEKMKECRDAQEFQAARGVLRSLVGRASTTVPTDQNQSIDNVCTAILNQAQNYLESTEPSLDVISADKNDPLTDVLSQATGVSRSFHGRGGVYYPDIVDRTPKTPLFKIPTQGETPLDSNPRTHIVADRFYSLFGFIVPNYGLVHKDSDLGQKVFAFLKKNGDEFYNSQTSPSPQQAKFEQELSKTDYIFVMDEIKGTTFAQAEKDYQKSLLRDEGFLQSIGEMIFFDAVIGNTDRMGVMPDATAAPLINLGNFMVLREGCTDSEGRKIALIDHDFNLSRENYSSIETNVKRLANPNDSLLKDVAAGLLQESSASAPTEQEKNELLNPIRKGFERAKRKFVDMFDIDEQDTAKQAVLKKLFSFPNDPRLPKFNQNLLVDLRNALF